MNLASCLAHTLWAEGPSPILYCSIFCVSKHLKVMAMMEIVFLDYGKDYIMVENFTVVYLNLINFLFFYILMY